MREIGRGYDPFGSRINRAKSTEVEIEARPDFRSLTRSLVGRPIAATAFGQLPAEMCAHRAYGGSAENVILTLLQDRPAPPLG